MSVRWPTYLSMAINIALLGAWLAAGKNPETRWSMSKPKRAEAQDALPHQSEAVTTEISGPAATSAPLLRWADLSSEDLKAYRGNLRKAGCPEATVRDIMRAVINDRFVRRRQELVQPFAARYWDMLAAGARSFEGISRQLAGVKEERDAVLKEILGDERMDAEAERAQRAERWKADWSWLPPSKVAHMVSLEEKYQTLRDQLETDTASRSDGKQTPADQAARKQLADQFKAEREALLTGEEREELQMRESGAAQWAESLRGFEPDESELRAVARLKLDATKQSEAELQTQIKSVLGDERYAEYDRARNGDFSNLSRVTERYGLPEDAAVQAFETRRAALAAAEQIRQNTGLSEADRRTALEAIRHESEQALAQTLGREVLATYREHGGEWVAGLAAGSGDKK